MKLDDFLKCKKVRCIKAYDGCLKIGKEYSVLDIRTEVKVKDDEGAFLYWESDHFEPVLEPVVNPLQNIELTPEFETVAPVLADNCEVNIQDIGTDILDTNADILDTNADIKDTPKFEVGDPVYWGLKSRIFKVYRLMTTNVLEVELDGAVTSVHKDELCPATLENYGKLCSLFECIDFEQPPKPLKGSDLCFEKLRNGKKLVMCAVSDLSDEKAIKRLKDGDTCIRVIKDCDPAPYHFIDTHGIRHGFAVPLNDETGEPLTQAVLDE